MSPQTPAVRSRPLVGRDREIAEVAEVVGSVPLTTLTGPGGVGKTALALAVAAKSEERFPDGVIMMPPAVTASTRRSGLPAIVGLSRSRNPLSNVSQRRLRTADLYGYLRTVS